MSFSNIMSTRQPSKQTQQRRRLLRVRSRRAAILIVVMVLVVGLIAFGLLGLSVMNLNLSSQTLQSRTDASSLTMALELNKGNYAGHLNQLIVGSRELVADARWMQDNTNNGAYSHFTALANQIVERSRQSAGLLAQEEKRMAKAKLDELTRLSTQPDLSNSNAIVNGTSQHQLAEVDIGDIDEFDSATLPPPCSRLSDWDIKQRCLEKSRCYKAGINLKMPTEDSDLVFVLSRLAPCRLGVADSARLWTSDHMTNSQTLVKDNLPCAASCAYVPSAVKVVASSKSPVGSALLAGSAVASTSGQQESF